MDLLTHFRKAIARLTTSPSMISWSTTTIVTIPVCYLNHSTKTHGSHLRHYSNSRLNFSADTSQTWIKACPSTSGPPCLMNPFLLRFKRQITPTLTELRRPCSPRVRQSVNLSRTTTSAHNFLLPHIAALQPAAVKAAAASHRTISSSATTLRQLGEVIRRHVYRCHRHANKQLPIVL